MCSHRGSFSMVYLLNGNFPADQLDLEEGDDVEVG